MDIDVFKSSTHSISTFPICIRSRDFKNIAAQFLDFVKLAPFKVGLFTLVLFEINSLKRKLF